MDKILKFLMKVDGKQRDELLVLIDRVVCGDDGLKAKKLSGFEDLYRVRFGKIRIVYRKTSDENVIIGIGFRGGVYKDL